jgi:3-hydroxyacyl-[acyl-carrier-protein] dehydratase
MSREQILAAIPHRPPMLLLDEVVEWEHERIVCQKTFHPEEFFFQGHYPEFPLVPGVILCEAAMQAGAVLLSKHPKGEASLSPDA